MTIGIIAAMEEELVDLKDSLSDLTQHSVHDFEFFSGQMGKHDAVLMQCGIGKVNAAVGTALLIDRYHPDYIINSGVAGGLYDTMSVGDIVVSTDVKHHDVDATVFNYEYGQIPRMPVAYDASQKLIELAGKAFSLMNADIRLFKGTIMSGDSFIHKEEQIDGLKSRFPFVMAVEMEGAAIAQTCYLFSVPFVVIRSISDIVTVEGSHTDYETFVRHASKISATLVKKLIDFLEE